MSKVTPDSLQILVLDDDEKIRRSLTRHLAARGHDVKGVGTVLDALMLSGPYDVAVLDIDLPDGSGIDAARVLLSAWRVKRVVFFTGETEAAVLARAALYGTVIQKPDVAALLAAL